MGLNRVLKKIDETGSIERTKCAGRPRSVRCDDNIERVVRACVKAKGGHFEHRLTSSFRPLLVGHGYLL